MYVTAFMLLCVASLHIENEALRASISATDGQNGNIVGIVGLAQRLQDLERSLKARFQTESETLRIAAADAKAAAAVAAVREQQALEEKKQMEEILQSVESELIEVERAAKDEIFWLDEALARAVAEKTESAAARRNGALARLRREDAARRGAERTHQAVRDAAVARLAKAKEARDSALGEERCNIEAWGRPGAVFGEEDAHLIIGHMQTDAKVLSLFADSPEDVAR